MSRNNYNLSGLNDEQVLSARAKYGVNKLDYKRENGLLEKVILIAQEPMMILLLVAASIYFLTGNWGDGIFMAVAIIFQASISLYQDSRSKNALDKLKEFSQPNCKVIRNGKRLK